VVKTNMTEYCMGLSLTYVNPDIDSVTFFTGANDETKVALEKECNKCGNTHEITASVDRVNL
jgi:hypothetical protein